MKVFLDTNVLVSALATRGLCADLVNAILAEHELLVGETVLKELQRVLKQKLRIPTDIVEEADRFFRREATVVHDAPVLAIEIRDSNDRRVLSEAAAGGADVFVTGDHDLLNLGETSPIPITDPRGLWERLRAQR